MATVIGDPIQVNEIETKPISGQKPGTSGLRKKVTQFTKPNYLHNFIQSYFNALRPDTLSPNCSLLVGGDGRYLSAQAIEIVAQVACANGVNELHVALDGVMSTPACSAYIRELNQMFGNCLGGILLTASHNPGGPHQDFGVKFNSRNGGPAQQEFTNLVYKESTVISSISVTDYAFFKTVNLSKAGDYHFINVTRPAKPVFIIKVVENVTQYVGLMKKLFDFEAIRTLLNRSDFKMIIDGMYGAAGPYAKALFGTQLGNKATLKDCDPKPDFNGGHPDPNLTCAKELVEQMGLYTGKSEYDFGIACDGDADRNMILGKCFFVTPSDSLALLASHSQYFLKTPLQGVARSMPTSGAVDKVALKLGIKIYQTPTGWKFFGNLMEKGLIGLCGQQSFGTGSPHVREKDGLWTVLAWLQVLAKVNVDVPESKLIGVEALMRQFWQTYGRNYYSRYDYENIQKQKGEAVWNQILSQIEQYKQGQIRGSIFNYIDPVDKSISQNQGLIFAWPDGSRVVFRQSGTGSVGITIRIYFEKYEAKNVFEERQKVLASQIAFGLKVSQIQQLAGKSKPDVIT